MENSPKEPDPQEPLTPGEPIRPDPGSPETRGGSMESPPPRDRSETKSG